MDKSVYEMSPKVSTRCHLFCPGDVTYYVHEMSATHSISCNLTRIINLNMICYLKTWFFPNYNKTSPQYQKPQFEIFYRYALNQKSVSVKPKHTGPNI